MVPHQGSWARRARRVGRTLSGRYFLGELLGAGGLGAVYEARDLETGRRCALKLIDREHAKHPEVRARVAREVQLVAAVDSPHVVRVVGSGEDEGRPFVVMERLDGEDLGAILEREKRLDPARALRVVADVLEGLGAVHAVGVIHRDMKPDNVFVRLDGRAVVLDFGLSRIERPRDATAALALTGRGSVLGTPHYLSPEQARGDADVDERSDVYGAGAVLFECLTGRPPHVGESWTDVVVHAASKDAPDVRRFAPETPPEIAALVGKALARERSARFSSALAMATAARVALASVRPSAVVPPANAVRASTRHARWARTVALAAAGLAAGSALVWLASALVR